jgi:hypothetical protein
MTKLLRINRMILGVATPVARFVEDVFRARLVDVVEPAETIGADVLVVGRQGLLASGGHSFASDVIPECLAIGVPQVLVAVIPDRFSPTRYARDLDAWCRATDAGSAVFVLEVGALREQKDDPTLVPRARDVLAAPRASSPMLWLSGERVPPRSR